MVEILDETNRYQHAEVLAAVLTALLEDLGLEERDVTVVLVDDDTVRRLNKEHRGVDEVTDVLSYPTSEPDDRGFPAVHHLGDIFISIDTASRQALEHGHDLQVETLQLAAHGVTHLQGFDHRTEEEWQIFREAQRRIVALAAAS